MQYGYFIFKEQANLIPYVIHILTTTDLNDPEKIKIQS